jgi:hypothetical protein
MRLKQKHKRKRNKGEHRNEKEGKKKEQGRAETKWKATREEEEQAKIEKEREKTETCAYTQERRKKRAATTVCHHCETLSTSTMTRPSPPWQLSPSSSLPPLFLQINNGESTIPGPGASAQTKILGRVWASILRKENVGPTLSPTLLSRSWPSSFRPNSENKKKNPKNPFKICDFLIYFSINFV